MGHAESTAPPSDLVASLGHMKSQQEPDMQGTIMSLDSAIQMISGKKNAVLGDHVKMIGKEDEAGSGGDQMTSLDEIDMSNMQD